MTDKTLEERVLINLGIICLLASSPHRSSKEVVDGTFFQDVRLSLESKLLGLLTRNFDKLRLWKFLDSWCEPRPIGDWRVELEARNINSKSFERHIRPLYRHTEGELYVINPGQEGEMFLYYNLSPNMVIDLSKNLIGTRTWFLGHHEVFSSEPLGDVVQETKRRYGKE